MILVGVYLCLNALYIIILLEWDRESTILFLQGQSPEHIKPDILDTLLTALNISCAVQLLSITFGLLPGALLRKVHLIAAWLWVHCFQLAFYGIYWITAMFAYSIVEDSSKVILLLYGLANILIGFCAWKMALGFITECSGHRGREEEPIPSLNVT
jgi:hypothetical protein